MPGDRQANGASGVAVVVLGTSESDDLRRHRIDRIAAHRGSGVLPQRTSQALIAAGAGVDPRVAGRHGVAPMSPSRSQVWRSRMRCSMTISALVNVDRPSSPSASRNGATSSSVIDDTSITHCSQ